MLLEEKIYARLSALVGPDNLYPLKAPVGFGVPAVIYNVLTEVPVRDLSEDAHTAAFHTIQIDTYDVDFVRGLQLARTIRRNFLEWDADGVQVMTCTNLQKSIDDTTDTDLYRVMVWFSLFVREDDDKLDDEDEG